VSEWTSVCPTSYFVVQKELAISNFVTYLFTLHHSTMKRNDSLQLTWHRKNTNNRSLKQSLSLFLSNTHKTTQIRSSLVYTYTLFLMTAYRSLVVTLYITRFNTTKFYVLPTQCIYLLCMDLGTNSDFFPTQH